MYDLSGKVYRHLPIPFQNAIVSLYGWKILRQRFGPEFDRLSEFLERSERFSCEEQRAYQEERLRALIHHAYENVPHYRGVMDERKLRPSDIRTLDDLPKLPILERENVESAGDGLVRGLTASGGCREPSRPAPLDRPCHSCGTGRSRS